MRFTHRARNDADGLIERAQPVKSDVQLGIMPDQSTIATIESPYSSNISLYDVDGPCVIYIWGNALNGSQYLTGSVVADPTNYTGNYDIVSRTIRQALATRPLTNFALVYTTHAFPGGDPTPFISAIFSAFKDWVLPLPHTVAYAAGNVSSRHNISADLNPGRVYLDGLSTPISTSYSPYNAALNDTILP